MSDIDLHVLIEVCFPNISLKCEGLPLPLLVPDSSWKGGSVMGWEGRCMMGCGEGIGS